MPMKIEIPANLKAVGEDQDMVLKGVAVDSHIIITNPSKEMHLAQIRTKVKSLCRNMIMLAPVVAKMDIRLMYVAH